MIMEYMGREFDQFLLIGLINHIPLQCKCKPNTTYLDKSPKAYGQLYIDDAALGSIN